MGNGVVELCKEADKVFLGLHGSVGENGQLQALLDLYGIPYTGTGYEGSFLAMDKDLSKKLIRMAGVHTPDWVCWNLKQENALEDIQYPCVVKPRGCGSSIGVTFNTYRTTYDYSDEDGVLSAITRINVDGEVYYVLRAHGEMWKYDPGLIESQQHRCNQLDMEIEVSRNKITVEGKEMIKIE